MISNAYFHFFSSLPATLLPLQSHLCTFSSLSFAFPLPVSTTLNHSFCLIVTSLCLVLSPQRAVSEVQCPAHLPLSSAPFWAFLHLSHWCGELDLMLHCCTTHYWQSNCKEFSDYTTKALIKAEMLQTVKFEMLTTLDKLNDLKQVPVPVAKLVFCHMQVFISSGSVSAIWSSFNMKPLI